MAGWEGSLGSSVVIEGMERAVAGFGSRDDEGAVVDASARLSLSLVASALEMPVLLRDIWPEAW